MYTTKIAQKLKLYSNMFSYKYVLRDCRLQDALENIVYLFFM